MAQRFKRDKFGLPDPLHFELPHGHKKLMEVLYYMVLLGAIVSILLLNVVGILAVDQKNASMMMLLFLSVILAVTIIEKSMVAKRLVGKPAAKTKIKSGKK